MLFKGQLYNELVKISVFLSYVSHSGKLQLWELLICCQVGRKCGQPEDRLLAVGVWRGGSPVGLSPWPVGLETNPGRVRVEPGALGAWGAGRGLGVRHSACSKREHFPVKRGAALGAAWVPVTTKQPQTLPPITVRITDGVHFTFV